MSTVVVMGGRALASVIVQSWVAGSKPGTGTSRLGAVEAGMSKSMLLGPGASLLEAMIAARSEPGVGLELLPLSAVLITRNVASSWRDSSISSPVTTRPGRDRARRAQRANEWTESGMRCRQGVRDMGESVLEGFGPARIVILPATPRQASLGSSTESIAPAQPHDSGVLDL